MGSEHMHPSRLMVNKLANAAQGSSLRLVQLMLPRFALRICVDT